jgi:hypothetical protein
MIRTDALVAAITPISEKLRREAKRHLFWSKFMGNITKVESYNNDSDYAASGKPIEVNDMFTSTGLGDRMLIPMTMELAGLGRLGDAVMLGHEEDAARKYAMIHYNQIRHGVPIQKGKKAFSVEKMLAAMEDNVGKLGWWMAQRENWDIASAIYLGAGEALTTSTTDATYGQGLGLDKRIHPNLYWWGGAAQSSGTLTRIGTTNYFPTMDQVHTAIYTTATTTGLSMSTSTLRQARTLVYNDLYLKPMFTHNGQKYWGIVIDPAQADTLRADAMFNTTYNAIAPLNYGLQDNPLVTGSLGIYGNFVIFEDPVAVRGYHTATSAGVSNGDPSTDGSIDILGTTAAVYDSTDKVNPRFLPMAGQLTSNSGALKNRGAIILGGSMVGKAVYDELGFENESFDYNNWKGIAAGSMYGYERLDFIPESQTPTYGETTTSSATPVYNRSSAIITTFQN